MRKNRKKGSRKGNGRKEPSQPDPKPAPSAKNAEKLSAALEELEFLEVIRADTATNQVRLMLRVHNRRSWQQIATLLLREEARQDDKTWSLHICRQWLVHPDDNVTLVITWNLILQSRKLVQSVNHICRFLDMITSNADIIGTQPSTRGAVSPLPRKVIAPSPKNTGRDRSQKRGGHLVGGEMLEYPLLASADRNKPGGSLFEPGKKQKGAHLIGER